MDSIIEYKRPCAVTFYTVLNNCLFYFFVVQMFKICFIVYLVVKHYPVNTDGALLLEKVLYVLVDKSVFRIVNL